MCQKSFLKRMSFRGSLASRGNPHLKYFVFVEITLILEAF